MRFEARETSAREGNEAVVFTWYADMYRMPSHVLSRYSSSIAREYIDAKDTGNY